MLRALLNNSNARWKPRLDTAGFQIVFPTSRIGAGMPPDAGILHKPPNSPPDRATKRIDWPSAAHAGDPRMFIGSGVSRCSSPPPVGMIMMLFVRTKTIRFPSSENTGPQSSLIADGVVIWRAVPVSYDSKKIAGVPCLPFATNAMVSPSGDQSIPGGAETRSVAYKLRVGPPVAGTSQIVRCWSEM